MRARTVTYTLTYTIGDVDVTNGVITDVVPAGLTYVDGSATGNTEFTFVRLQLDDAGP